MIIFIQVNIMCCLFTYTITVPFVLHLYLNNCLVAFIFFVSDITRLCTIYFVSSTHSNNIDEVLSLT